MLVLWSPDICTTSPPSASVTIAPLQLIDVTHTSEDSKTARKGENRRDEGMGECGKLGGVMRMTVL